MKKAFIISYLILFFFILATCAQKVDDQVQVHPINSQEQVDLLKAKQVIESTRIEVDASNKLLSCHSATASIENRLAPPLEAVKRRYLMAYPDFEEFTSKIADYAAEPREDKAIMFGAVERFDLMTPIPYSEEDLVAIATYIYQFDLERPEWFDEHYQEMHGEDPTCSTCSEGNQGKHKREQRRRGQGGS